MVGVTAEPVQLENLIAFDPDLIITLSFTLDDPYDYWSIDPEILPQVREVAPILAISGTGDAGVSTERFAALVAARTRYEDVVATLEATAAEKDDLQVLFIAGDTAGKYVAYPPDWSELSFYQAKGVNLVVPDAEPGTYWEQISHEQAPRYPSDIIKTSARPGP